MRDWYKNCAIYSLDVVSFKDGGGDGCGDLLGVSEGMDYLAGLGIDCLWMLPIFDSPRRDNYYDVSDYYRIAPELGDFGDFALLVEKAKRHGIRIIIDLPVNHTSVDHPWFRRARDSRDSKYRDFYIWSDEKPENSGKHAVFGAHQTGNWVYDEQAEQYYYHTFYDHEPDLNFANPRVRGEIERIMRFWLAQGVDGFRIDAAPHMMRQKGHIQFARDPHEYVMQLRDFVQDHVPEGVLLAEADVDPARISRFFRDGREFNMVLNFYLCEYLFLALAREDGEAIARAFDALPRVEGIGQWANFLRNHDELDLERLRDDERDAVMRVFAPQDSMRLYGRGIRRRLAPMLADDRRRLELAHSLLFSLPGTPIIRQGEEIGMGDDLSLNERDSVRTLMQWSREPNGGFSEADSDGLVRPIIREGAYGYLERNVSDQLRDPESLLNWMARVIRMRRHCPEFGIGRLELIRTGDRRVFAHLCRHGDHFSLAAHNLCDQRVTVELELPGDDRRRLLELFGNRAYERWDSRSEPLTLDPYGYRWFRRSPWLLDGTPRSREASRDSRAA